MVVSAVGSTSSSLACSVIAAAPEAPALVGGNYDWTARGGIVFLSPRGQLKSAELGHTFSTDAEWSSRYASLTVSQFGRDFPMQGLNEQGLAGMVLIGPSAYPSDGPEGIVTENLWLQYQLDRFATVAEVEAHIHDLGFQRLSASLHWFLCDATNDCAVIEFIGGRPSVRRGNDLPIRSLTNTSYEQAMSFYVRWQESTSPMPEGYASSARFVRLAERRSARSWLDLAETLDQVSLAGFTAFQSLFDLQNRSLTVRLDRGRWHSINFENLPLDCGASLPMLNLSQGSWQVYDHNAVANLFTAAAAGAPELGGLVQDRVLRTSERVTCNRSQSIGRPKKSF